MPNPLTGDFDAVLQVSGGVVNRLMASLHQNAGAKPNLPSHPHSASFRIGDGYAIEGVRGWVDAQLGSPRINLIHGVSDRFEMEVDVRARFLADAGSTPLPEFTHGVVNAQYRIYDIDPDCAGWAKKAKDYLWFKVERESVRFTGTAADDVNPLVAVGAILDEAEVNARIVRQIAGLLTGRFAPAPHKVSARFRAGRMRSLNAPIGGSAVALAVSLDGSDPAGNIASVNNLFLDGHDFAIALNIDVLMGLAQPMVDDLRTFTAHYTTVIKSFAGPTKTIHHTAHVTAANATWEASGGDQAILRIKVDGVVDSDSSWAPDIDFHVNQAIWVGFDAGGEKLTLWAAGPIVSVNMHGLFATQSLADKVRAAIENAVKARTANLPSVPVSGRADLVTQLATLDDMAGAAFEDAVFTTYGVAMRGRIWLAPRKRPQVKFHMLAAEDGFSAYEAWAPGGRIDSFTWKWTWGGAKTGDSATRTDRFLLRRPRAARSKFGGFSLGPTEPLPGIDGSGVLCLTIRGVRTNAITGHLDPFVSQQKCERYGVYLALPSFDHRLLQKLWPEVERPGPRDPGELGLLDLSGYAVDPERAHNTLIVHFAERFDGEAAHALERGLAHCRREDAGLAIIGLFREGALQGPRDRLVAEVEALAAHVGAPMQVMEDVGGGWCARLAMPPNDMAFRLITPGGGMTWMHDGRLEPQALAEALDVHLRRSPPARMVALGPALDTGDKVSALALRPEMIGRFDDPCPPLPLGRLGEQGAVISFVHTAAESSKAQLAAIAGERGLEHDDAPAVIAVVDGDADAAEAYMRSHPGLVAVPDPGGHLARRFGVRVWPTTFEIDAEGAVAGYSQGFNAWQDEGEHP